jgi:hypothetical protein
LSRPTEPTPAKLVVGFIYGRDDVFEAALARVEQTLGRIDLLTERLAFDWTDYYAAEMGEVLFRRVAAFADLIDPGCLVAVKRLTLALEDEFSVKGRRRVNLDPGYVTLERLVLATGKNFVHRIYLGGGVYADLTLIYQDGRFRAMPWTYPDYAGEELRGQFELIRRQLRWRLSPAGTPVFPEVHRPNR